MPVEGWIIPENRALRPVLPLPMGFLLMLTFCCMMMGLVLHLIAAAIGAFGFGWGMGKAMNRVDDLAWGIMAKNLHLPQRLIP